MTTPGLHDGLGAGHMKRIRVDWTGYLDPFGTPHSAYLRLTLPLDMSMMPIFRVSSKNEVGTAIATIPDEFLALALEHGVRIHASAHELDEHDDVNFRATRPKIRSLECHGEGLSEMKDANSDGHVIWQWKITAKKKHPAHAYVCVRACDDEVLSQQGLFVTHRLPAWYESTSARRLIVVSIVALGLSALAAVASAIAVWYR